MNSFTLSRSRWTTLSYKGLLTDTLFALPEDKLWRFPSGPLLMCRKLERVHFDPRPIVVALPSSCFNAHTVFEARLSGSIEQEKVVPVRLSVQLQLMSATQ
jgi:hypothetical protein